MYSFALFLSRDATLHMIIKAYRRIHELLTTFKEYK